MMKNCPEKNCIDFDEWSSGQLEHPCLDCPSLLKLVNLKIKSTLVQSDDLPGGGVTVTDHELLYELLAGDLKESPDTTNRLRSFQF